MYKVFYNDSIVFFSSPDNELYHSCEGEKIDIADKNEFKDYLKKFFSEKIKANKLCMFHPDPDWLLKRLRKKCRHIIAGGGLVRNEEREWLVIYRRGKWDLPKGKAEAKETIVETAVREVQEECNINELKVIRKIGITYHCYSLKSEMALKETHWYEMLAPGKHNLKPQIKEDITEVKWIKASEVTEIKKNSYPSLTDIFEEITT